MDAVRIGVVGDYRDNNETHTALAAAIGHAAERPGLRATTTWIPTPELEGAAGRVLADFDAVWIAPGSPYASMRGALEAITHARTPASRCSVRAAASSTSSSSSPARSPASPTPPTPRRTRPRLVC